MVDICGFLAAKFVNVRIKKQTNYLIHNFIDILDVKNLANHNLQISIFILNAGNQLIINFLAGFIHSRRKRRKIHMNWKRQPHSKFNKHPNMGDEKI